MKNKHYFLNWLKDKGYYEDYCEEIKLKKIELKKIEEPMNYVVEAFDFMDSKKGNNFWCRVSSEWDEVVLTNDNIEFGEWL